VDSFSWNTDVSDLNLLQYALFVIVVAVLVKPLGGYMARVFGGEKTILDPVPQFMPLAAQERALREELRRVGQEQPPGSSVQ
jgi:hypothetical protein